jgi:ABC-type amino acid transport substrate-binding protein
LLEKDNKMEKKLKIGLTSFSPLVIKKGKKFAGFEVELWQRIAKEINKTYEYKELPLQKIIPEVNKGNIDVGFAGLTINGEREKLIDFSHHTFNSGLQILVSAKAKTSIINSLKTIFNKEIRKVFLILLGFVILAGHALWLAEKGSQAISDSYLPGIFEALWWGIVTVSTVGYGDFTPETWLGRFVGALVILIGLGIFGLYIAKVSSLMTIKKIKSNIVKPVDLKDKIVATKEGTPTIEVLKNLGANVVSVKEIEKAFTELEAGNVDAVVFDAPTILYYANNQGKDKVKLAGKIFDKQSYGFVISENNPLREKINRAILKLRKTGFYGQIYRKWFGQQTFK